MSEENSKKVIDYIQLKLDIKKTLSQISGLTTQIAALNNISGNNGNLIKSINVLREQLKNLNTFSEDQNKKLAELTNVLVIYRDQNYVSFINSKIDTMSSESVIGGNQSAIVDKIKRAANKDWDERLPLGGLPSKKLEITPNRLAAQKYLNDVVKNWEQRKYQKADQLESVTPSGESKNKLLEIKSDIQGKINEANNTGIEIEEITNAQGVSIPDYQPSNPRIPSSDVRQVLSEVSSQRGYSAPSFVATDIAYEPSFIPQINFSPSEAIPVIRNEFSSQNIVASDPLDSIDYSRTQLMSFDGQDDIIDPREVEIIIPSSFASPIPAFLKVFNNTGIPVKNIDNSIPTLENILTPGSNLAYNQFSVTALNQTYGEKFQIDEVLTRGLAIQAFGKKPRIWMISGTLINDLVSKWKVKFEEAFDNYLNISALSKSNAYVLFTIPAAGIQFSCYPLSLDLSTSISNEANVPFNMPVLVRSCRRLTTINVSPALQKMIQVIADMQTKRTGVVSRNAQSGNTLEQSNNPALSAVSSAALIGANQTGTATLFDGISSGAIIGSGNI